MTLREKLLCEADSAAYQEVICDAKWHRKGDRSYGDGYPPDEQPTREIRRETPDISGCLTDIERMHAFSITSCRRVAKDPENIYQSIS
jgi:hypothetical protein